MFITTGLLFAATEVRLLGNVETILGENLEETIQQTQDNPNNIYGFSWEVIINKVGLGGHYGVIFNSYDDMDYPGEVEWWMDWKGDFFVSGHIFGAEAFIDPFIEIGVGNTGRTYINSTADKYYDYNEYNYRNDNESNVTNMSLFPYVAGGVAVNFSGLIFGGKANYILANSAVPGTKFDIYPMNSTSLTIFAGISL